MIHYGLAADIHLHAWSAFSSTTPEGINSRLSGLLQELKRLAKETHHAAGPGAAVVLAGDVFHVRGQVSPTVLNSVKDTLSLCHAEYKTNFVILAGNHDLEGKESTRLGSAVTALEASFIRVVNAPMIFSEIKCALVPWFEKIDELKEAIENIASTIAFVREYDLILHAPIDGVIEGLPPHGLTPEYLAALGFKRIFSGHYHDHKEFPGNVFSIGALAHHTWSDVGSKAGFLRVGERVEDVTWFKSHLPAFIDLDKLDAFSDVEMFDADELQFVVDRNFVRLKCESAKSSDVERARAELLEMGAAGVQIIATPTPPVRDSGVTATVAAGASIESSIGAFINAMKGEIDIAEVFKESMSILSSADELEV